MINRTPQFHINSLDTINLVMDIRQNTNILNLFYNKVERISIAYDNFLHVTASYTLAIDILQKNRPNTNNTLNHIMALEISEDSRVAILDAIAPYISTEETISDVTCRMHLVAMVSAFEVFIQDIYYEILLENPKSLLNSADKTVKLEDVLGFTKMEELIGHIARQEANKSTDGAAESYLKKLDKRFKLGLSGNAARSIDKLVALRNIVIHNNAVIDQAFIKRTGISRKLTGYQITLDTALLQTVSSTIQSIVQEIELLATQKYSGVAKIQWTQKHKVLMTYCRSLENAFSDDNEEAS